MPIISESAVGEGAPSGFLNKFTTSRYHLPGQGSGPSFKTFAGNQVGERSQGPEDGMEKSVEEINRVLESAGALGKIPVERGSTRWTDPENPESSEATEDLIERASTTESLLYVGSIGAPPTWRTPSY